MKKNVWILNHYAGDTFFDHGGRHYWFAEYLKKSGYCPTIFVANSIHGKEGLYFQDERLYHEHTAEEIDVPYVFVKARPYSGSGKKRIENMMEYSINLVRVAEQYAKEKNTKPDVVIASSVHPMTLLAGLKIARIFGTKCVTEIRDLWPESIVAYGLIERNSVVAKILYWGERWIYKKADAIVFTMEGAYDYILEQGWEKEIPRSKVHFINNGVDLDVFDYNKEHYRIENADLENPDIFKVVYTGSIRKANNLGLLIDAAKKIRSSHVKILIWGAGDELEALEKRIQDEGIRNVSLKGRVDKKYIPYITSQSDLNFLDVFDERISKYGISSNKLFEYFAAGHPILISRMRNCPMQNAACNIYYDPSAEGIASCIERVVNLSEEQYRNSCSAAKEAANAYSFKHLTKTLVEVIEGLG